MDLSISSTTNLIPKRSSALPSRAPATKPFTLDELDADGADGGSTARKRDVLHKTGTSIIHGPEVLRPVPAVASAPAPAPARRARAASVTVSSRSAVDDSFSIAEARMRMEKQQSKAAAATAAAAAKQRAKKHSVPKPAATAPPPPAPPATKITQHKEATPWEEDESELEPSSPRSPRVPGGGSIQPGSHGSYSYWTPHPVAGRASDRFQPFAFDKPESQSSKGATEAVEVQKVGILKSSFFPMPSVGRQFIEDNFETHADAPSESTVIHERQRDAHYAPEDAGQNLRRRHSEFFSKEQQQAGGKVGDAAAAASSAASASGAKSGLRRNSRMAEWSPSPHAAAAAATSRPGSRVGGALASASSSTAPMPGSSHASSSSSSASTAAAPRTLGSLALEPQPRNLRTVSHVMGFLQSKSHLGASELFHSEMSRPSAVHARQLQAELDEWELDESKRVQLELEEEEAHRARQAKLERGWAKQKAKLEAAAEEEKRVEHNRALKDSGKRTATGKMLVSKPDAFASKENQAKKAGIVSKVDTGVKRDILSKVDTGVKRDKKMEEKKEDKDASKKKKPGVKEKTSKDESGAETSAAIDSASTTAALPSSSTSASSSVLTSSVRRLQPASPSSALLSPSSPFFISENQESVLALIESRRRKLEISLKNEQESDALARQMDEQSEATLNEEEQAELAAGSSGVDGPDPQYIAQATPFSTKLLSLKIAGDFSRSNSRTGSRPTSRTGSRTGSRGGSRSRSPSGAAKSKRRASLLEQTRLELLAPNRLDSTPNVAAAAPELKDDAPVLSTKPSIISPSSVNRRASNLTSPPVPLNRRASALKGGINSAAPSAAQALIHASKSTSIVSAYADPELDALVAETAREKIAHDKALESLQIKKTDAHGVQANKAGKKKGTAAKKDKLLHSGSKDKVHTVDHSSVAADPPSAPESAGAFAMEGNLTATVLPSQKGSSRSHSRSQSRSHSRQGSKTLTFALPIVQDPLNIEPGQLIQRVVRSTHSRSHSRNHSANMSLDSLAVPASNLASSLPFSPVIEERTPLLIAQRIEHESDLLDLDALSGATTKRSNQDDDGARSGSSTPRSDLSDDDGTENGRNSDKSSAHTSARASGSRQFSPSSLKRYKERTSSATSRSSASSDPASVASSGSGGTMKRKRIKELKAEAQALSEAEDARQAAIAAAGSHHKQRPSIIMQSIRAPSGDHDAMAVRLKMLGAPLAQLMGAPRDILAEIGGAGILQPLDEALKAHVQTSSRPVSRMQGQRGSMERAAHPSRPTSSRAGGRESSRPTSRGGAGPSSHSRGSLSASLTFTSPLTSPRGKSSRAQQQSPSQQQQQRQQSPSESTTPSPGPQFQFQVESNSISSALAAPAPAAAAVDTQVEVGLADEPPISPRRSVSIPSQRASVGASTLDQPLSPLIRSTSLGLDSAHTASGTLSLPMPSPRRASANSGFPPPPVARAPSIQELDARAAELAEQASREAEAKLLGSPRKKAAAPPIDPLSAPLDAPASVAPVAPAPALPLEKALSKASALKDLMMSNALLGSQLTELVRLENEPAKFVPLPRRSISRGATSILPEGVQSPKCPNASSRLPHRGSVASPSAGEGSPTSTRTSLTLSASSNNSGPSSKRSSGSFAPSQLDAIEGSPKRKGSVLSPAAKSRKGAMATSVEDSSGEQAASAPFQIKVDQSDTVPSSNGQPAQSTESTATAKPSDEMESKNNATFVASDSQSAGLDATSDASAADSAASQPVASDASVSAPSANSLSPLSPRQLKQRKSVALPASPTVKPRTGRAQSLSSKSSNDASVAVSIDHTHGTLSLGKNKFHGGSGRVGPVPQSPDGSMSPTRKGRTSVSAEKGPPSDLAFASDLHSELDASQGESSPSASKKRRKSRAVNNLTSPTASSSKKKRNPRNSVSQPAGDLASPRKSISQGSPRKSISKPRHSIFRKDKAIPKEELAFIVDEGDLHAKVDGSLEAALEFATSPTQNSRNIKHNKSLDRYGSVSEELAPTLGIRASSYGGSHAAPSKEHSLSSKDSSVVERLLQPIHRRPSKVPTSVFIPVKQELSEWERTLEGEAGLIRFVAPQTIQGLSTHSFGSGFATTSQESVGVQLSSSGSNVASQVHLDVHLPQVRSTDDTSDTVSSHQGSKASLHSEMSDDPPIEEEEEHEEHQVLDEEGEVEADGEERSKPLAADESAPETAAAAAAAAAAEEEQQPPPVPDAAVEAETDSIPVASVNNSLPESADGAIDSSAMSPASHSLDVPEITDPLQQVFDDAAQLQSGAESMDSSANAPAVEVDAQHGQEQEPPQEQQQQQSQSPQEEVDDVTMEIIRDLASVAGSAPSTRISDPAFSIDDLTLEAEAVAAAAAAAAQAVSDGKDPSVPTGPALLAQELMAAPVLDSLEFAQPPLPEEHVRALKKVQELEGMLTNPSELGASIRGGGAVGAKPTDSSSATDAQQSIEQEAARAIALAQSAELPLDAYTGLLRITALRSVASRSQKVQSSVPLVRRVLAAAIDSTRMARVTDQWIEQHATGSADEEEKSTYGHASIPPPILSASPSAPKLAGASLSLKAESKQQKASETRALQLQREARAMERAQAKKVPRYIQPSVSAPTDPVKIPRFNPLKAPLPAHISSASFSFYTSHAVPPLKLDFERKGGPYPLAMDMSPYLLKSPKTRTIEASITQSTTTTTTQAISYQQAYQGSPSTAGSQSARTHTEQQAQYEEQTQFEYAPAQASHAWVEQQQPAHPADYTHQYPHPFVGGRVRVGDEGDWQYQQPQQGSLRPASFHPPPTHHSHASQGYTPLSHAHFHASLPNSPSPFISRGSAGGGGLGTGQGSATPSSIHHSHTVREHVTSTSVGAQPPPMLKSVRDGSVPNSANLSAAMLLHSDYLSDLTLDTKPLFPSYHSYKSTILRKKPSVTDEVQAHAHSHIHQHEQDTKVTLASHTHLNISTGKRADRSDGRLLNFHPPHHHAIKQHDQAHPILLFDNGARK